PLLSFNHSRANTTALAESKTPAGAYQITRPRWYNKAEVAIILLLVQRLRLLDVRGVEHMLEATEDFRKQDPRDVMQRAMFLMKMAPGANFRTVIRRHPRTLLVPVHKMQRVFNIISSAYPDANIDRVVERIPSIFSRDATRLERNIAGLQKYAPEVDSAIFQAAPSMIFLPPATVEEKVADLRWHLPGMNLRNFLMGMPTALARSRQTVPRGLKELRKRFPTASTKELVRIIEAAPSLVRMSGVNGSLDIKVDALMALLPGVNMTNIISNAPGVLVRSTNSLPPKVEKLIELFPSANVTKMVSRTPGILYLDMDRTVKPKALWIQQAVGLDQEGLDRLIEQGPWLLKAGWGPLARIEFAISTGIARKDRPAGLVGLVRRSRAAFATAHHPAYANFLRQRLGEEMVDVDEAFEYNRGEEGAHPEAWWRNSYVSVGGDRDGHVDVDKEDSVKTMKLKNAVAVEQGKVSEVNEGRLMERTAAEVARLEDALGRGRKSRIGGVGDRQSGMGRESLSRLHGSPQEGDALLDLGREIIVRRKSQRLTP
ncbi:unnamed protein product, partial [Ascophyllum nodosum]